MPTVITEVQGDNIAPITMIDLTIGSNVYYISSNYKPITYNSNDYTELGAFLSINEISDNLKFDKADLSISLSGIPSGANYVQQIIQNPVKGGNVTVYRAFVDPDTMELTGNVYTRYKGVITNFTIDEQVNMLTKKNDYAVTVSIAGLTTVLQNKVSGQRTNPEDRDRLYAAGKISTDDKSFDRIPELYNTTFDFGKEYSYQGGGYYGGGGGRGGGGGCFPAGSMVTMFDGSQKAIEEINVDDIVMSFNEETQELTTSTVKQINKPFVNKITQIVCEDIVINTTDDHPIYIQNKGWSSRDAFKTLQHHNMAVLIYEIGDHLVDVEQQAHKIIDITTLEYDHEIQLYNLVNLEHSKNYFVNGILVHNKGERDIMEAYRDIYLR